MTTKSPFLRAQHVHERLLFCCSGFWRWPVQFDLVDFREVPQWHSDERLGTSWGASDWPPQKTDESFGSFERRYSADTIMSQEQSKALTQNVSEYDWKSYNCYLPANRDIGRPENVPLRCVLFWADFLMSAQMFKLVGNWLLQHRLYTCQNLW